MKTLRTYLVFTMALLIMMSATGISISLHKCCGSIEGFSLYGDAKACNMTSKASSDCSSKTSVAKELCCDNQQVSFNQSPESTSPSISKVQTSDARQGFDVLFVYTLFKNSFGTSEQEEDTEKPSPGLFIVEAVILLLQQFRI